MLHLSTQRVQGRLLNPRCLDQSLVAQLAQGRHSEDAADTNCGLSLNSVWQVWHTDTAIKELRCATREIYFSDCPDIGAVNRYHPCAKLLAEVVGNLIER